MGENGNPVEVFWSKHTVLASQFENAKESEAFIQQRFDMYPLSQEKLGLYDGDYGDIILDYGCGPGHDLVGFMLNTQSRLIHGMDISVKALDMARQRINMHGADNGLTPHALAGRMKYIRIRDTQEPRLPFTDESIDFINCLGVLHHVTDPVGIMQEFKRILKPTGHILIMFYSKMSIWYHLCVAYTRMILWKQYKGMTVDEAFAKSTDTAECPISRCWNPPDFLKDVIIPAGWDGPLGSYLGAYFAIEELTSFKQYAEAAITDKRLPIKSRKFLASLKIDSRGYPILGSKHVGFGAVIRLFGDEYEYWK